MKVHELKTWKEPFEAAWRGLKTHEIRHVRDRQFEACDVLRLVEWDETLSDYTGRECLAIVRYVSPAGSWGLPPDVCVMSILVYSWTSTRDDAPEARDEGPDAQRRDGGGAHG